MPSATKPLLYVKPLCPWCREALSFFASHGVEVEIRDVLENPEYMRELVELTGRAKTPSFKWGDFVVADFSTQEFLAALREHAEIARALGIAL